MSLKHRACRKSVLTSTLLRIRLRRKTIASLIVFLIIAISCVSLFRNFSRIASANSTAQNLPFSQAWTNTGLITANDTWTSVPGIEGYFLNSTNSSTAIDPQTVTTDTFNSATTTVELDVIANQSTPNTNTSGGVAEFENTQQAAPSNTNPTIALQGSGTADAPFILLNLNTTGWTAINVSYNLRDVDCSTDNAVQPVALMFRVGNSGSYTNVSAGFVADATSRTNSAATDTANCTQVTAVNATLPVAANNQSLVQVRILTTNAVGNDEWVGIDDISITGTANLTISDAAVLEGNAGTTTASFTVSLPTAAGPGGVTFDIATADNTATTADNDYVAKSLTGQTIPQGSSSYQFDVTLNGDTFIEPNETFFVNVTNVTGAPVLDNQGQGTIINDDSPPDLTIANVTQAETNSGTTIFTFTVSLSAPAPGGGVSFDIATAPDTASAGSDYVTRTETGQTISAGNSSYTFNVTVNGDTVFEPSETFFVNVTNVTGANVVDGQAVGTITNDDAQPTIAIADVAVTEGNAGTQLMTFTVTVTGTSQDTITVDYATADSSATLADVDYVSAGNTLTFVSGDTSETFNVTINGDTNIEGDEVFVVDLSNPSGATISDAQGLGIIFLDDALGISAVDTPVSTNFDVLAVAGISATTPAAWTRAESGTNANSTYAADNGGSNAGNTYSYGTTSASDRALGGLQSGSLTPTFGAFLRNDTSTTITQLLVTYTGEQWRIGNTGTARDDRLDFQYSLDATSLTTGSWTDVNPLDFTSPVKTAAAAGELDGNATANRTSISNVISGLSILPGATFWIRYNDFNPSGSDDGLAVDDFSITANPVLPDTAPSVTGTVPADNATGVALSANISVTFSEAVAAPAGAFSISCGTSGAHTFVLSTTDNTTFTLNPDSNFSSNENCTVTVEGEQVTDADTDDPPENMAADYVFDFTIATATACGATFTPIYTIQGSGTSTPIPGAAATEGVVIGDFQGANNLKGFYIQDPSGDGNTATSDGIFVFDGNSPAVDVNVGDRVRVDGTVSEAFNNTQIAPGSVQICSTGNPPPAATVYDLPEPVNGDLERVENMLVTFPETLTVTGNFTWGRFGELVLSSDGRLFQQNSFDRPNTAGALARASLNERAYVVLDDGQSIQNPNPIPYISADNTRRAGDTVAGLTGVLTFDFSEYRVQPTVAPVFAQANPRPAAPASVGGNLKVAASNVLNYFNGDGAGGGFPTARGADTLAEFNRQRAKIIAALTTINADVIGISEMENDGGGSTSALQDLVNGMNAATAPGTYIGLHSPNPGTDLIQNAIIYKPASVTPVGPQVNDIDAAWGQARPPLAQTFQHNGNFEVFTFIVNHFTSKGCSASDTGIDADVGDGQGCDNGQRQLQANRLLVFIQARKTASGDPDVLAVGDFNDYGEEDPNFILEQDASDTLADGAGGLISQTERFVPAAERYSFQFDSQFGELDHAFATKTLSSQVSGTTIWHINADEPVIIDYNQEFKVPSGTSPDLYTPTPYRAADHDPLVVGLNLTSSPQQAAGSVLISEFRFRGPGFITGPLATTQKIGTSGIRMPGIIGPTNQAEDEFIEIYNNTNSDITVSTTDGSAGWALVASDGVIRFIIPNNTVIPARGHFLGVNTNGYSLASYGGPGAAAGDQVLLADGMTLAPGYTTDIPDGSGIALFRSANSANFTLAERLDAAGYAGVPELYREGTGFATGGAETTGGLDYTFFRSMTRATGGLPRDTGDNTSDFFLADTAGTDFDPGAGTTRRLGAPGPENLSSPINRTSEFGFALLDPNVSAESTPNRERNSTVVPSGEFGTLTIRRTFTNNTGETLSKLRFRIVEITTLQSPVDSSLAQLRALSSEDELVAKSDTQIVLVRGTTLEEPPFQFLGGGWNATLNVPNIASPPALDAKVSYDTPRTGTILLSAPLNNGASIDVQFKLGVMKTGFFFFYVNIEASPGCPPSLPCEVR